MVVEVPCVAVQHYDRVPLPIDQDLVGALLPHGTPESFGVAVGRGQLRGDLDDPDTPVCEHGVERGGELGVPIADQMTKPIDPISEVGHQIAGLLGDPVGRGMFGDAQDVDPPGAHLHHEQDIQSAQPDGVDVEEIGGQQSFGLGSKEHPPRRIGVPPGRRAQPCRGQDPPDRPGAEPVAEAEELALDSAVVPAGFSRARRTTSPRISSLTGGRPVRLG